MVGNAEPLDPEGVKLAREVVARIDRGEFDDEALAAAIRQAGPTVDHPVDHTHNRRHRTGTMSSTDNSSGAYTAPNYNNQALTPSIPSFEGWLDLPSCSLCGAVVADPTAHNEWHAALWIALFKATATGFPPTA